MSKTKNITGNTKVWSAVAWWRDDSDPSPWATPSMQAVALTPKKAEAALKKLINEAARYARDDGSYTSLRAALDDIAWSGSHLFALKDLAASARELDKAISDIESRGVWFPPTP